MLMLLTMCVGADINRVSELMPLTMLLFVYDSKSVFITLTVCFLVKLTFCIYAYENNPVNMCVHDVNHVFLCS